MPSRTSFPDATFSHVHGIAHDEEWFDPVLNCDTQLFVDPFLMFDLTTEPWNTIHDRMIDFFNRAMGHVAAHIHSGSQVEWEKAAEMFSFPEPPQFCLGYGQNTIFGAGTSQSLGASMLNAARQAIQSGVTGVSDFGELMRNHSGPCSSLTVLPR